MSTGSLDILVANRQMDKQTEIQALAWWSAFCRVRHRVKIHVKINLVKNRTQHLGLCGLPRGQLVQNQIFFIGLVNLQRRRKPYSELFSETELKNLHVVKSY